jgi:chromosome segregation ATPase
MSDFGLKIGIEGEKQFKSALADINRAFRVLGSEMAVVTSQFDKNDKSINALTSRNAVLNKEITAQKDKIELLKTALKNSADSFGENDKRTQEWQIKLNKAQAELNGMERELTDNNKALDKADKALDSAGKGTDEFGKSVDKAGDEIDETGKETNKLGKEMDETSKKTSVFGDVLKATLLADAIKAGAKALVDMVKSVGTAVKDYVYESSEMATESAMAHTLLTQVMENMMDATDGEVDSLMRLIAKQEELGVVSKTAQTTALAELASFVERKESLEDKPLNQPPLYG